MCIPGTQARVVIPLDQARQGLASRMGQLPHVTELHIVLDDDGQYMMMVNSCNPLKQGELEYPVSAHFLQTQRTNITALCKAAGSRHHTCVGLTTDKLKVT